MFRVTIKGLMAHKLRLAATGLAVVLGVSFMSGTYVLTDTIKATFTNLFKQANAGTDVVVRAVAPYGSTTGHNDQGPGNTRPRTPESLIATVQGVPGVQYAAGAVGGQVTLLDKSGKALKKQAPTLGFNWVPVPQLSPINLKSGRGPHAADEVTLDVGTAKKYHFALGDRVTIISDLPPQQFTIVGITGFGTADNVAGATITTFDTPTAQRLFGKVGQVNEIDVHAAPGTNADRLLTAIGARLPNGFEAVTGAAAAQQQAKTVSSFTSIFSTFLLAFAGIALFVGGFLIFNTFSILVGQRTRELALLRAVGASKGQVNRSVLGEALVVGLTGSIVGIAAGLGLAAGIYGLLKSLGIDLPKTSLQLLPRTIIVGLIVGTVVTVVSAILPARRAATIPPVAAMREDGVEIATSLRRRAISGGVLLAAGLATLFGGLVGGAGIALVGLGVALTFLGVATLAPFVTGRLARVIGSPLPAIEGVAGRLGQENAARNPRRTAATSSALMVGLAVVAAIATIGASGLSSFNRAFTEGIHADFVLTSTSNFSGFSPSIEPVVRRAPGVVAASPIVMGRWYDGRVGRDVEAIDAVDGPKVLNIPMVSGSVSSLQRNAVIIDDKVAKSHHLRVGDTLMMGFPSTGVQAVAVGGIYKNNPLGFPLGSWTVSTAFLAANVNQLQDDALVLKTASRSPDQVAALHRALTSFPNVKTVTDAQFKKDQAKRVSTVLTIVYALIGLSILIALIGVVNTLALSVLERKHEIGLLRAVGMQRRQVKRMIRGEAVVVSLIGAVLGLTLGLGLGAAMVRALSSSGFNSISLPIATVITVLVLTAVFGVGAAVFPARRAAKLDVLAAIATT